jgi:mRNA interferase MazF
MRRGDVWWADLPKPIGRRPVVLVSRNDAYQIRARVIVVPVTARVRGIRAEVSLGRAEGLPRACVANADTVTTIAKDTLVKRAGSLAPARLAQLDEALRFALQLDSEEPRG